MSGETATERRDSLTGGKTAEAAVRSRANWAWSGIGYCLFLVGLVGLALPVLPTTIFWIGAAACFAKSCPAMQQKIFAWPVVGRSVEDFLTHGVIRTKSKKAAFLGMILAAGILVFVSSSLLATTIGLALILIGAIYVGTRPSRIP